jgi:hypothetical protein
MSLRSASSATILKILADEEQELVRERKRHAEVKTEEERRELAMGIEEHCAEIQRQRDDLNVESMQHRAIDDLESLFYLFLHHSALRAGRQELSEKLKDPKYKETLLGDGAPRMVSF